MFEYPNTLALIPAREGSKGVPKKNIKLLNGRPLIHYTIKVCQDLNIPFLVSTDSNEIKNTCSELGYESDYVRPSHLAQDNSSIIDCAIHALEWLSENSDLSINNILLLQPTSPLRNAKNIKEALNLFYEKNLQSMFSVTPMREHPLECININNNDWDYLVQRNNKYSGRQQYEKNYYFVDGTFYLSNVEIIIKKKNFLIRDFSVPFIIDQRYSIDIDTIEDFNIVEQLMRIKK